MLNVRSTPNQAILNRIKVRLAMGADAIIMENGLPSAGRLPTSRHPVDAKGIQFPLRRGGYTVSTNLDVIWGMSISLTAGARRPTLWATGHD